MSQAVIKYILECFPYLLTPYLFSYHNYSMSYGTLNMEHGVGSSQKYQFDDNSA